LEAGADFVIGSRYVPGGSIPREWSFYRQLNSKFGNIVARYLAGIRAIKDCTAGFRCIRTDLLARIDLSTIRTQGYGFQVSLLHAAFVNGARIQEIPVRFTDRIAGESKLGLKDIIEFVLNAGAIRLRSSETFLRFSAVGCSGILVNLGFFMALSNWCCSKFVASAISIALSILWNFIWNYHWTFRARQSSTGVSVQGLQFNLISLVTFGCSFATFVILCSLFPEHSPLYFQVFSIIPATLLNYFLNSYWTFVDRKNMLG
ncbi:MAG: GtrA family protein, partial [Proteobacteria bacterium]|nr:GtrA family protein [Pseudomonadota bacterium]